jgi:hypothetical protein
LVVGDLAEIAVGDELVVGFLVCNVCDFIPLLGGTARER